MRPHARSRAILRPGTHSEGPVQLVDMNLGTSSEARASSRSPQKRWRPADPSSHKRVSRSQHWQLGLAAATGVGDHQGDLQPASCRPSPACPPAHRAAPGANPHLPDAQRKRGSERCSARTITDWLTAGKFLRIMCNDDNGVVVEHPGFVVHPVRSIAWS